MKLFVILLITLFSLSSFGYGRNRMGWEASLQFSYESYENTNTQPGSTTTSDSTEIPFYLKFGHTFANSVYVGAAYHNSSFTGTGSSDVDTSLVGATVGYRGMNWYIDASYFFMGELEQGNFVYTKSSGMQVDVGYRAWLTDSFAIAPILSWRSLTHDDLELNGNPIDEELERTEIRPYLGLVAVF